MRVGRVSVALLVVFAGCGPSSGNPGGVGPDASQASNCDPSADTDNDCIPDGVEGCQDIPPRDRDRDGNPDYTDVDSDGDGLRDGLEAGDCQNPIDTDGDGLPDYLDPDSDNDGVRDGDEDRNGDGMIGTCSQPCASNDHCGPGENCSIPETGGLGVCVSLACAGGETDPHNPDTDGDGKRDGQEGTFICNPRSEDNPNGLKPIKYADSSDTMYAAANWRLALEQDAFEGVPVISSPTALESAYTFDLTDPATQVAGFLASRPAVGATPVEESNNLIAALQGSSIVSNVTTRVSGTATTSLDGFPTVLSAVLELTTSTPVNAAGMRAALLPILLSRPAAQITMPPAGWTGTPDTQFVLSVQTIRRPDDLQTLYIGAVARLSQYDDRTTDTGFHVDDVSNGTGNSVSGNGEAIECEQFVADQQATADIIWVVNESGSVNDDRQRIADNASSFFNKAVAAGLDFRMGVTDMNDTGPGGVPGIFASRAAGGGDRWLLPNEPMEFENNINDPSGPDVGDYGLENGLMQGRAAIMKHLPRNDADPTKIREEAKLVVIYVTDEKAQEVEDAGILSEGNVQPDATQQAQIDALVAPYINDFINNNAVAHLIAEPPPFSATTCSGGGAEHAYGYYELINAVGGQIGSICQADLGPTLDAIIDSIIGDASPITLSKYPISASIAVARDGAAVPRSRDTGWDYRANSNSIVFFNMPFDPANPSDIVISYRRWDEQVPIN